MIFALTSLKPFRKHGGVHIILVRITHNPHTPTDIFFLLYSTVCGLNQISQGRLAFLKYGSYSIVIPVLDKSADINLF